MTNLEDNVVYARVIDLSHCSKASHGVNVAGIHRRAAQTKELYEQLQSASDRQRVGEAEMRNPWREQLRRREMTVEQLREKLYQHSGVDYYLPDHHHQRYYSNDALSREQISSIIELEPHIEALIDRTMHEQVYPALIAARDYENLRLLVVPDGATDDFCYEFSSLKKTSSWECHLEALRVAAHLDAYLLDRANILAHIHIRSTGREEMVREPVDRQLARNYLDYVRYNLKEMANGAYWEKFDPSRQYTAVEQAE